MSEQIKHDPEYKPSWKNRRKTIFGTLIFDALLIAIMAYKGGDSVVDQTIVVGAFSSATVIIGSYVFGAAYESVRLKP